MYVPPKRLHWQVVVRGIKRRSSRFLVGIGYYGYSGRTIRLGDHKIVRGMSADITMNATTDENYTPDQVLQYWFNGAEDDIEKLQGRSKIWYSISTERDDEIRRKFGTLLKEIVNGQRRDWSETSSGALALVLVLDQFTRQIYRKKAEAFAHDEQAIDIAYSAISQGLDQEMSVPGMLFCYHPFQHSEKLKDQEFGVQIVRNLLNHCEQRWHDYVNESLRFFEEHCQIIHRFNRFPHRNEVLQRTSTPAEIEFLRSASRYGQ